MKTHLPFFLFRILLCAGLLLPPGCSGSEEDSLVGEWTVSFAGTHIGTAAMFINSDGAFDFTVTLSDTLREALTYRAKGIVDTNGHAIVGKLYEGTEEVGLFQGYMRSTSSCDGDWSVGSGAGSPRGDWTGQKR
jgi:hypothetical protein